MRQAEVKRETRETKIEIVLDLDGTGKYEISTGIGEAISELRQLNITSEEAAALAQVRAEEQYAQYLLDLEEV